MFPTGTRYEFYSSSSFFNDRISELKDQEKGQEKPATPFRPARDGDFAMLSWSPLPGWRRLLLEGGCLTEGAP